VAGGDERVRETGLSDLRDRADEYQGLPAAFLAAGAATVVSSLWAVNDASTALLMQGFHANLYQRGLPKGGGPAGDSELAARLAAAGRATAAGADVGDRRDGRPLDRV
jgi:hypothetical protein